MFGFIRDGLRLFLLSLNGCQLRKFMKNLEMFAFERAEGNVM